MILFNKKTNKHYMKSGSLTETSVSFDQESSIEDEEAALKKTFDALLKDKKKKCFFHIFSKPTTTNKEAALSYVVCVCDLEKKPVIPVGNKEWWG